MNNLYTIFQCPSCKSNLKQNRKIGLLFCNSCNSEVHYTNNIPVLIKNFSEIQAQIEEAKKSSKASWYKESQENQLSGPYRHHIKKRIIYLDSILSDYKSKINRKLSGLDLGCGDGHNLTWLTKYVEELYGSDFNLIRLIRASRVKSVKQIFLADVTDYPVINNQFDVIFFNHVLEHIKDDGNALGEVYRILKPGGIFILGVPNEGALFWKLAYRLQPEVLSASDHVHFYTARSIKEKCINAGFSIINVHPIGWGVPHWRLDEKIRRYKLVDDLLEILGRIFFRSQSTSLYLIATKN